MPQNVQEVHQIINAAEAKLTSAADNAYRSTDEKEAIKSMTKAIDDFIIATKDLPKEVQGMPLIKIRENAINGALENINNQNVASPLKEHWTQILSFLKQDISLSPIPEPPSSQPPVKIPLPAGHTTATKAVQEQPQPTVKPKIGGP